jgi:hypothetical protein
VVHGKIRRSPFPPAFNVVDRVADATGIPLDDMMLAVSADLREQLGLARFASAANTPGGR